MCVGRWVKNGGRFLGRGRSAFIVLYTCRFLSPSRVTTASQPAVSVLFILAIHTSIDSSVRHRQPPSKPSNENNDRHKHLHRSINHAHAAHHAPHHIHSLVNNMRRPRHAQTTHHPHPQPTTLATVPHAAGTVSRRRQNNHSPHHSHQLRPVQHHHGDSHAVHRGRDHCRAGSGADVVCGAAGGGLRSDGVRELQGVVCLRGVWGGVVSLFLVEQCAFFFCERFWADDVLLCSEQCDTAPYCQCEV